MFKLWLFLMAMSLTVGSCIKDEAWVLPEQNIEKKAFDPKIYLKVRKKQENNVKWELVSSENINCAPTTPNISLSNFLGGNNAKTDNWYEFRCTVSPNTAFNLMVTSAIEQGLDATYTPEDFELIVKQNGKEIALPAPTKPIENGDNPIHAALVTFYINEKGEVNPKN